jgi:hypothetical protein
MAEIHQQNGSTLTKDQVFHRIFVELLLECYNLQDCNLRLWPI